MNQEQIKMGMKISKKISKKNAKNANNKHGNDDDYYKNVLLEVLKLPKDSDNKHYKDMIEIMKNIDNDRKITKLNQWVVNNPKIINKLEDESAITTQFIKMIRTRISDKGYDLGFTASDKKPFGIFPNNAVKPVVVAKEEKIEVPPAPKINSKPALEAPATPTIPNKEKKGGIIGWVKNKFSKKEDPKEPPKNEEKLK